MTSFFPEGPWSFFSSSSGWLCLKKRMLALERIAPSTMLAWEFWSATIRSPGRINPAISPTFML